MLDQLVEELLDSVQPSSVMLTFDDANALSLRRLVCLALFENSKHFVTLAFEALEHLATKKHEGDMVEFLSCQKLTTVLADNGILGHSLAKCAQRGQTHMCKLLAPHTTFQERILVAMREVSNREVLALLHRACTSNEEEFKFLQACLNAARMNGEEEDGSLLVRNLQSALHCLEPARKACDSDFEQDDEALLQCVQDDDARGIHLRFRRSTEEALLLAAEGNKWNACVALLKYTNTSSNKVNGLLTAAAENGAYETFSRLLAAAEKEVDVLDLLRAATRNPEKQSLALIHALVSMYGSNNQDQMDLICAECCAAGNVIALELLLEQDKSRDWAFLLDQAGLHVECSKAVRDAALRSGTVLQSNKSATPAAVVLNFVHLNDDVLERVFAYLPLHDLAQVTKTCQLLAARVRREEQTTLCLVQDIIAARTNLPMLSKYVYVFSSQAMASFKFELACKQQCLRRVLTLGQHAWAADEFASVVVQLGQYAADGEVALLLEMLLKVESSGHVIQVDHVQEMLQRALDSERFATLAVLLKLPGNRFGGSRVLVEQIRNEASRGNVTSTSLLTAALSRLAMESRAQRNNLILRRKEDWEARGGIWGPHQQEQMAGPTDQELDFDLAVGGALWRASENGHAKICTSLLLVLKARNRLQDFIREFERMFECAARNGHDLVLQALFRFYLPPLPAQQQLMQDTMMIAARNGHQKVARLLVWDRKLVPVSEVKFRFVECARKGHFEALKTLMATGAIGSGTCSDAMDEALRRGHEDCLAYLREALARLEQFEKEEELPF